MPSSEPSVAAGLVREFVRFSVAQGADRSELLRHAAIGAAELADQDARVIFSKFRGLVATAKELTGDAAIALRFGKEVDISQGSIVALIGFAADTLFEAISLLNKYGRLMVDVPVPGHNRFVIQRRESGAWLVDTRNDPNMFPELTEYTFARIASVGLRIFGENHIRAVHVTHEVPPYASIYRQVFDAPVYFLQRANRLLIDDKVLHRKGSARQPKYALPILARHADELLQRLDSSRKVRAQAEAILLNELHLRGGRMDVVAKKLGLSRETLRRRLKGEGTTFEQVLDQLRCVSAAELIAAGVPVKRAALLTGYSDTSSFSRSFKRWTGKAPSAYARIGNASQRTPS